MKLKPPPELNLRSWPADNVRRWPVEKLVPYARNARLHTKEDVRVIATSIAKFGFTNPILVAPDGTIIAGHGRVLAAKLLGLKELPVMVAQGWIQEEIRAYCIADNQIAAWAEWDMKLLASEIANLAAADFDLNVLGFDHKALAAPSMKDALEAWGANQNLFHQGFATNTDDPSIIAATKAQPGIVLKRAVGSKGAFKENAELPKSLPTESPARSIRPKVKAKKAIVVPSPKANREVGRAQVVSFERARAKRALEREKEETERVKLEAVEARQEKKREKAVAKARAMMDRSRERHDEIMVEIERERLAVERRADTELKRWDSEVSRLEDGIRKAKR